MTSTALLVMDVQQDIVARFTGGTEYLPRLAGAITAARDAGIGVVYVTVAFRPGYPEVSDRNKSFSAIAGTGRVLDGSDGIRVHPAVAPAPGEVTVTKRQAADLDFQLTVLSDGCLDADPEVHWILTEKVFPRQADVVTIAEWSATLKH